MSFEPGHVIADKYRIVRMIGRGGVGEVYEGENLRIRRRVAIKTLKAEFVAKADIVQRFEREAQAAGRIGSAHIVEVVDLGDLPDGSRFLVMEFLEGETLSRRIKTVGRMTPVECAHLVVQLLEGLGGAHAAGIVHRDLKPANIYLVPRNGESFVKILDFGVSKFNTLASDELAMTKTGVVVGTPYYMAPEQAKGSRTVDGRADIYAVGVIAYECVTGQVPFSAQTFNELLFKIVLEAPPPIEQFVPDVDPHFASLVRKAMSREPNMRFQTAAEFQQALSEWLVQATGGALGHTLAQTATFEGGGAATMILQTSLPQPPPPRPAGAPSGDAPQPMHAAPPAAGWSSGGDQPSPQQAFAQRASLSGEMAPDGLGAEGFAGDGFTPRRASLVPWIAGGSMGLLVLVGAVFAFVRWGGDAAASGTGATSSTSSAAASSAAASPPPSSPPSGEPAALPPAAAPPAEVAQAPVEAAPTASAPGSTPPGGTQTGGTQTGGTQTGGTQTGALPPTTGSLPPGVGQQRPPVAPPPGTRTTPPGTGRPAQPAPPSTKTGRPISGDL